MSESQFLSHPSGEALERSVRVDAPHPIPSAASLQPAAQAIAVGATTGAELAKAAAGRCPAHAEAQVQVQAAQLGERLQQRHRELDRREAQLNAESADLEAELRAARLWLHEQNEQLDERERELLSRAKSLDEKALQIALAGETTDAEALEREKSLGRREAEIGEKQAALRKWESQLHRQTQALRQRERALEQEREQGENELLAGRQRLHAEAQATQQMIALATANLERHRAALEEQEHRWSEQRAQRKMWNCIEQAQADLERRALRLDEAERLVEEQRASLEEDRRGLIEERSELARREAERNAAWDERAVEAEAKWRKRREGLARRFGQIEQRRLALETLHAETVHAHRQTLEMRLAIDQLWLQLRGAHPPATLTQSLAETRRKLAEHARRESAALLQQKDELKALADRLITQQKQLSNRRGELERWAADRHREIEEQAALLVGREQELDRQERQFHEAERAWREEKRDLQRRLRQALSQALHAEAA